MRLMPGSSARVCTASRARSMRSVDMCCTLRCVVVYMRNIWLRNVRLAGLDNRNGFDERGDVVSSRCLGYGKACGRRHDAQLAGGGDGQRSGVVRPRLDVRGFGIGVGGIRVGGDFRLLMGMLGFVDRN